MIVIAHGFRLWHLARVGGGMGHGVSCPTYGARCVNLKIHAMAVLTVEQNTEAILLLWGQGRPVGLPRSYPSSYATPRVDSGPPIIIRVPALGALALIDTPQEIPL